MDYLVCPKCGSVVGLRLKKYIPDSDALAMACESCGVALLIKPLDHPDRRGLWNRLRRMFTA
jgi:DNA-directed RNA polymerase subunit RPC12/RpoP